MKGLLTKDLYMTLKYCKFLFLIDLVFIMISFISEENALFMLFPILFAGVIPVTLLSLDERSGWNVYSGTMPYSRGQLVSVKYLTAPIIGVICSAVILGLMILRMSFLGETNISEALIGVGAVFAASLLLPAICLPFCIKFGTEKGRIVYFVVIILITAAVGGLTNGGSVPENLKGILPIIPAAIALLYAASWVISIALYKRKAA